MAALDKNFALQPRRGRAIANEAPASESQLELRTLQVHNGKLVIAPKGVPLAGFRTPFPFSFTSEVDRGTLQADFVIPADDYELTAGPEAQVRGHERQVFQFNLPVKGRDNNVTRSSR